MSAYQPPIFALATPPLPSAAALIRVAGGGAPDVARALLGASWTRASVRGLLRLAVGETPCVAWLMPAPRSLTGDDTLELIVPGHAEILRDLEQRLRDLGCRDSEPGEFTRRAVEAGKLGLAQAEATLALVTASDETARRQAMADLGGESSRRVAQLAERLRALSARYEMSFDFSEEEHAEAEEQRLEQDLRTLTAELRELIGCDALTPRRAQPEIALFGPPNAGKSSLFNAIVRQRRALVSDHPGTTRDAVRRSVNIEGRDAVLVDLSGVGAGDADLGRFAENARAAAIGADVLLVLAAPGGEEETRREFDELAERDPAVRSRALWVFSKSDLRADTPRFAVSAASGAGMNELREALAERLAELAGGGVTSLLRRNATQALALLEVAQKPEIPPEAIAAEVRRALRLLDEGLLSEAPGEVLDYIFSRFCIGK